MAAPAAGSRQAPATSRPLEHRGRSATKPDPCLDTDRFDDWTGCAPLGLPDKYSGKNVIILTMLQTGRGRRRGVNKQRQRRDAVALLFLKEDFDHEQNHHCLSCYYSVELGYLGGRENPPRQEAGCSARGEHARPDEFVRRECCRQRTVCPEQARIRGEITADPQPSSGSARPIAPSGFVALGELVQFGHALHEPAI
jgi:hypothetical protein